jgi:hypothetical protein
VGRLAVAGRQQVIEDAQRQDPQGQPGQGPAALGEDKICHPRAQGLHPPVKFRVAWNAGGHV